MRPFPQGERYAGFFRGPAGPCIGIAIRNARPLWRIRPDYTLKAAAEEFPLYFGSAARRKP